MQDRVVAVTGGFGVLGKAVVAAARAAGGAGRGDRPRRGAR